jgi:hypothetical protein
MEDDEPGPSAGSGAQRFLNRDRGATMESDPETP